MTYQTLSPVRLKSRRRGTREAVEMLERRFGYFPRRFRWRGKVYEVDGVERCWTSMKNTPRLCFRVHYREGRFDLSQDIRLNKWEVALA
jgi:hypothetical protein